MEWVGSGIGTRHYDLMEWVKSLTIMINGVGGVPNHINGVGQYPILALTIMIHLRLCNGMDWHSSL